MSLKTQLESDFLTAYKAKDDKKVSVLRMLKSSIKNAEIAGKTELDDSAIIKILRREAKQLLDANIEFAKSGRGELVAENMKEIGIINEYLPTQLDEDQITKIVDEIISELKPSGPADFGRVIGAVMAKTGGNADGSMVSEIIKKRL